MSSNETPPRSTGRDLSALRRMPLRATADAPAREPNTEQETPEAARSEEQVAPDATPKAPKPTSPSRQRRQARPAAPPPPAPGGKKPTPVYMAAAMKTRLEHVARADGVTLTEWVLDAFDELYEELPELFEPVRQRRSPLPARQRVVRPRSEASSTVQLRMTDEELEAIDQRRTELGVASRSALLARVIEVRVQRAEQQGS
jgi:hypothetical protein